MLTAPFIPIIGLLLIVANIALAATRPYWSPTAMAIQLFIGGMTTLLIAVIDLINPLGITELEQVLLFVSGCINCALGYYMTLLELRRG
jgi:vacuolar-type H+-ATPase subunit I/STV1